MQLYSIAGNSTAVSVQRGHGTGKADVCKLPGNREMGRALVTLKPAKKW